MWSYLAAAAREQRARQERDELAAELAEKQGKGRAAEFLERIGFVGRLATYLVFFGLSGGLDYLLKRGRCRHRDLLRLDTLVSQWVTHDDDRGSI